MRALSKLCFYFHCASGAYTFFLKTTFSLIFKIYSCIITVIRHRKETKLHPSHVSRYTYVQNLFRVWILLLHQNLFLIEFKMQKTEAASFPLALYHPESLKRKAEKRWACSHHMVNPETVF
jgi:hypothetical protein